MEETLNFAGEKYISAKIAAKKFGYASDYVGQLCRQKKIKSHLVGRNWYVLESDLSEYKKGVRSGFYGFRTSFNMPLKKDARKAKKESFPVESRVNQTDNAHYLNDERELLPNIIKKIDLDSVKFLALKRIEDSLSRPRERSDFEKFVAVSVFVLMATLSGAFLAFDGVNFVKSAKNYFVGNPKEEAQFVYGPLLRDVKNSFASIRFNQKNLEETHHNSQLAAASSAGLAQSAWGWLKEGAKKIIRPWIEEDNVLVIVNESPEVVGDVGEKENLPVNKNPTTIVQSRTVVVPASDREYLDLRIDQRFEELKNYFLTNPIAPNVNRYYVTRQNDAIVDSISRTTSSSSSSSGGVSNLSELSDITLTSLAYGNLLMYNGSEWVNTATSSLGISGSGTVTSISTNNGLTGGDITTTGTIGLNTAGFSVNGLLTWDGSNLVATGTPQLTVGNILATSTNATSTFEHNLAINGTGTTTSNGGFNISAGCFAINGTCIGGGSGSGSGASTTLLADSNTWSGANNFTQKLGLSSSTPWAQLSINPNALGSGVPEFVVGSSSATHFIVDGGGNVGIGATSAYLTDNDLSGLVVTPNNNLAGNNTRPAVILRGKYSQGSAGIGDFRINASDASASQVDTWAMSFRRTGTFGGGAESLTFYFDRGGDSYPVMGLLNNANTTFFGNVGVSTTTPYYALTTSSSTAPQLSLSAGAGIAQWVQRNAGGNFYLSTTTVDGTSTTSISAL
ncbi:MAG TPA: helix-turn-helix domain-containing protein, partial [Candidatus Paceibacterota bacterium]